MPGWADSLFVVEGGWEGGLTMKRGLQPSLVIGLERLHLTHYTYSERQSLAAWTTPRNYDLLHACTLGDYDACNSRHFDVLQDRKRSLKCGGRGHARSATTRDIACTI